MIASGKLARKQQELVALPTLPIEVNRHIASLLPICNLMTLACVSKEFASEIVPGVKKEWAAAMLLRICRAYVPALRARKANPAIAFFSLAQHAKRRALAYNQLNGRRSTNPLQYVHFVVGRGALVVSRSGDLQFIDDMMDGEWVQLDSRAAISTFLAFHPRAVDRLKHVVEFPWGQEYFPILDEVLGVAPISPSKLFEDGVIKPALPAVIHLTALPAVIVLKG